MGEEILNIYNYVCKYMYVCMCVYLCVLYACTAWAVSWESGLHMVLIPTQLKRYEML